MKTKCVGSGANSQYKKKPTGDTTLPRRTIKGGKAVRRVRRRRSLRFDCSRCRFNMQTGSSNGISSYSSVIS